MAHAVSIAARSVSVLEVTVAPRSGPTNRDDPDEWPPVSAVGLVGYIRPVQPFLSEEFIQQALVAAPTI